MRTNSYPIYPVWPIPVDVRRDRGSIDSPTAGPSGALLNRYGVRGEALFPMAKFKERESEGCVQGSASVVRGGHVQRSSALEQEKDRLASGVQGAQAFIAKKRR
jgi:hypothetical protein